MYANARYLDPKTSRWMSSDPAMADGLNWYSYVNNNPIMYKDPTGLMIINHNMSRMNPRSNADSEESSGGEQAESDAGNVDSDGGQGQGNTAGGTGQMYNAHQSHHHVSYQFSDDIYGAISGGHRIQDEIERQMQREERDAPTNTVSEEDSWWQSISGYFHKKPGDPLTIAEYLFQSRIITLMLMVYSVYTTIGVIGTAIAAATVGGLWGAALGGSMLYNAYSSAKTMNQLSAKSLIADPYRTLTNEDLADFLFNTLMVSANKWINPVNEILFTQFYEHRKKIYGMMR
ncbi:RHS repeat-associated core domain-containing protein [Entomospira entomophila]|nr:RHS repeat-associated core domain-containing protein [Entomospira entomophilus]WDI36155.1 RHS repeat-associated core domain-containing protein [Entomospira entomophilus]